MLGLIGSPLAFTGAESLENKSKPNICLDTADLRDNLSTTIYLIIHPASHSSSDHPTKGTNLAAILAPNSPTNSTPAFSPNFSKILVLKLRSISMIFDAIPDLLILSPTLRASSPTLPKVLPIFSARSAPSKVLAAYLPTLLIPLPASLTAATPAPITELPTPLATLIAPPTKPGKKFFKRPPNLNGSLSKFLLISSNKRGICFKPCHNNFFRPDTTIPAAAINKPGIPLLLTPSPNLCKDSLAPSLAFVCQLFNSSLQLPSRLPSLSVSNILASFSA